MRSTARKSALKIGKEYSQKHANGAVQLGFSGGEPLTRQDLPELVKHARELGYYSNLITSGYGLTEEKSFS